MVLKPDQQRVCKMLKDTITLLCKNGLNFKKKFNIEAVIGVTLDDDDMFHISMSEIIKSNALDQDSDSSYRSDESVNSNKRKRKKRTSVKTEMNQSEVSEDDENGADGSESDGTIQSNPAKRPNIKGEPEDEDDNSGDIVFVKQEMDDNWSASCSQGTSNFQNFNISASPQQQDHNFSSLSDMNLTPVSSTNDNNLWMQQLPQQYSNTPSSTPRMQRPPTSTVTGQPSDSPLQGADPSMQQSQVILEPSGSGCEFCGKIYFNKPNLLRHLQSVHLGIYPHRCDTCGKGFANKDNLIGHTFLHTGVMAYKCSICNDEFQYKSTLERHTKRIHKQKPDVPLNQNICS